MSCENNQQPATSNQQPAVNQVKNQISHTGHITAIEDRLLRVRVIAESACVSCSAKGSCSVGEVEEKEVEIRVDNPQSYEVGEMVTVVLDQSKGLHAILLGYVYPFLVLLFTLIIASSFTDNQAITGLVALGMLIPYYFALYLFRKHIARKFDFRLDD